MSGADLDVREVVNRIMKYVVEGCAVSLAAWMLLDKKTSLNDVIALGLTAAAVFSLLDLFAPSVGAGARQGAGLGVGFNMVKFP
jgi:predicted thioredoxin/glutaredoxin